jgi:hypothetical protein
MTKSQLSTEGQQIALDLIIGILSEAYEPLFGKKKELESLEKTEDVEFALMAINLRLDTLGKVQTKLLEPVKAQYVAIDLYGQSMGSKESTAELMRPGEILNGLRTTFVGAIMQGL